MGVCGDRLQSLNLVSPPLFLALGIVFLPESFTSRLHSQLRQFAGFLGEFPLQVRAWGAQRGCGAAKTQKRRRGRSGGAAGLQQRGSPPPIPNLTRGRERLQAARGSARDGA